MVALWIAACAEAPVETVPPVPEAPSVDAPPQLVLSITPVSAPESLSRALEVRSLTTAMVELAAWDLSGVVPEVARAEGSSRRYDDALVAGLERATLTLSLAGAPEALSLSGTLCAPACRPVGPAGGGTSADPAPMVAGILRVVSAELGRSPAPEADAAWTRRESADPYATLVAGRAAAADLGLSPAQPPELLWDKRRDVFRRALYIDPNMPAAGWLAARRALELGDAARAREFTAYALGFRSSSVALLATLARAESRLERQEAAWDAWRSLHERTGVDVRFVVPAVSAALALGRVAEAEELLRELPTRHDGEPRVAAARVAVHEARGPTDAYDGLLLAWQQADPSDPVPVRKRLALRVAARRWDEALALADELGVRGRREEADRAALAVYVAIHDVEAAAGRADALGDPLTAARLRARALLDPAARRAALADDESPWAQVAVARGDLEAGRPADAAARAEALLALRPWFPEALAVQADALAALGDQRGAGRVRERLDAALPLGPRGATP